MVDIVSNIEFQTLVHSTEDPNKVKAALLNAVGPLDPDSIDISSTLMHGYYKNPLSLLKVNIRDKRIINRTLEHLSAGLSPLDKEAIDSRLDLMLDKSGHLYLRLDKQIASAGRLQLGADDPIRVKIKFSPKRTRSRSFHSLCKEIGIIA